MLPPLESDSCSKKLATSGALRPGLRDGKIIEGWNFYDGPGLLRQLRDMPASAE
jgi:hypothetical protein